MSCYFVFGDDGIKLPLLTFYFLQWLLRWGGGSQRVDLIFAAPFFANALLSLWLKKALVTQLQVWVNPVTGQLATQIAVETFPECVWAQQGESLTDPAVWSRKFQLPVAFGPFSKPSAPVPKFRPWAQFTSLDEIPVAMLIAPSPFPSYSGKWLRRRSNAVRMAMMMMITRPLWQLSIYYHSVPNPFFMVLLMI